MLSNNNHQQQLRRSPVRSPLPNLKVPNCFGKDFDVGQQMEKAKEQTLSMFTKTKAAFSKGVNTVDQRAQS